MEKDKRIRELSIHATRKMDRKKYSVNAESKKSDGIYSTILCVYKAPGHTKT